MVASWCMFGSDSNIEPFLFLLSNSQTGFCSNGHNRFCLTIPLFKEQSVVIWYFKTRMTVIFGILSDSYIVWCKHVPLSKYHQRVCSCSHIIDRLHHRSCDPQVDGLVDHHWWSTIWFYSTINRRNRNILLTTISKLTNRSSILSWNMMFQDKMLVTHNIETRKIYVINWSSLQHNVVVRVLKVNSNAGILQRKLVLPASAANIYNLSSSSTTCACHMQHVPCVVLIMPSLHSIIHYIVYYETLIGQT